MATAIIHGPDYSTYVRTVRLTFEEKGARYELRPVHILGGKAQEASYLKLQPFGKVPAFEHDGLVLYETTAIIRYVDQVFPGKRLQPDDAKRTNITGGSGSPELWRCAGFVATHTVIPYHDKANYGNNQRNLNAGLVSDITHDGRKHCSSNDRHDDQRGT